MKERGSLPRWATVLLELVVSREDAEFLLGDLEERYLDELRHRPGTARRWLARQVFGTVAHWWSPVRWGDGGMNGRGGGRMNGMGSLVHDVEASLRSLVRRPGLGAVIVLTLGLGIGATTTIFSVVDGVLMRPLPYDDAHELVAVGTTFPGREWEDGTDDLMHLAGTSLLNYQDMKARARSFEAFGAVEWSSVLLPDQAEGPELVTAAMVDAGFFETLRVSPGLGRLFVPDEYREGERPVILSHGAWLRRYGGDPGVLGAALPSVGTPATVVGVLPADFQPPEAMFGETPELWLPLQTDHPRYVDRGRRSLVMVARLADGTTLASARDELMAIADDLAQEFPDGNVYPDGTHFGAGVNGLRQETVGSTGRVLGIFLASAVMLLLIAVLNAASLLLARTLDRRRELSVRAALGANGRRILRLLLAESVLLSVLGGVVGVALAWVGVAAFHRFGPSSLPRMDAVVIDGRILAVATAVAVLAGILSGILPALNVVRRPPCEALRAGGQRGGSETGFRLRSVMVSGQLGLAVLLLSGAGLLFHSFLKIKTSDPGFEPRGIVTFQVGTKRPGAPEGEESWQAWDLVLTEVRAVPGLSIVVGASNVPYQSTYWAPWIRLPGDPEEHNREGISGYAVTPGFHEAMGTRILQGRGIARQDGPDGPFVAVVNEAFVGEHLRGRDPIGFPLFMPEGRSEGGPVEIVGVVENTVQGRPEEGMLPAVYVPYTQADWPFVQVGVRSDRPVEALIPELRRAVARFSGIIPPQQLMSMDERMARTRTDPRFQALLLGTFAAVALLLAGAGLFASLSHAVGRRRRELGIRMALGAARGALHRMVVLQGLRVAGGGLALGLVGALGVNRALRSFLYQVDPLDPVTLTSVVIALVGVAALASLVPARRATGVDPALVLREE